MEDQISASYPGEKRKGWGILGNVCRVTKGDGRRYKKKEGVFTHEYRLSLSLRE